jgi:hypothetical protein
LLGSGSIHRAFCYHVNSFLPNFPLCAFVTCRASICFVGDIRDAETKVGGSHLAI